MSPRNQRPWRLWLVLATVLSLLAVLFPTTGATPLGSASPSSPGSVAPLAATAFAAPFAARAGFASWQASAVIHPAPATGSELVVVTFEPRDPVRFFAPPSGGPFLTPAGIAHAFGMPAGQYAAIEQYFRSAGLSVLDEWPDHLALSLAGSAAAVGRAFGTSLFTGSYEGRSATYPATPPTLPSSIEAVVGSVLGLSSGFDTFTTPSLTELPTTGVLPGQGSGNVVTPAIAREIYDLSELYNVSGRFATATSQSIALLLWGYGYSPPDISTFFQQDYPSGFPAPNVVAYPVDGAPSPSPSAVNDPCHDAQELTLDLEWSGSMAPGATLDAVYAPESATPGCSPSVSSMADALHRAVTLPVSAVSMSFGTPESSDASLVAAWQTYLSEAVQEGITLLAATGDLGGDANANCQGGPSPEYPSTSPDVLAVGGTDVSLNRNILGQITGSSETAWSGSGGGYSAQYSAPAWQNSGTGPRGIPDVSATAALNYEYFNGQAVTAAGTSFATPLWAGLITEMDALHGRSLGLVSPRLYSIGEAEPAGRIAIGLADVTSGSNCVGPAGPGWDDVTGWGSPRALALYEDLTATFVNLSIAVTPSTVAPGGTVTISGHLANGTTGAPIAGVPVAVSLASDTNVGPCIGTFGSSAPTTGLTGNVSVSISVPLCYFGAHAAAAVEVVSNGYYGTNSTSVAVNLLGLVPALGGLADYPANVAAFTIIMAVSITIGYFLGRGRPSTVRQSPPPTPPSPPPVHPPPAYAPGPPPPPSTLPGPAAPPEAVPPPDPSPLGPSETS
jgi:kumamolisin